MTDARALAELVGCLWPDEDGWSCTKQDPYNEVPHCPTCTILEGPDTPTREDLLVAAAVLDQVSDAKYAAAIEVVGRREDPLFQTRESLRQTGGADAFRLAKLARKLRQAAQA